MPSLVDILHHLPAWLLVLFRLTGIFFFAPMYGSRTIPARVKIMLALMLSLCIYPVMTHEESPAYPMIQPVLGQGLALWSLAGVVGMELLIGIIIGFGANLPILALQVGGRVVDQQLGMSIGGIINPELGDESGIIGEFYFIVGLSLFLIVGGHRILLATLIGTFNHVPLGGFVPDGHMLDLVVGLLASMFDLALRFSGPLLCLVFLGTVAMGFIARTVPQMNILSIGFPVRILVGILLLIVALTTEMQVYLDATQRMLRQVQVFFGVP